jgi:methionyl-tRNA synthetase
MLTAMEKSEAVAIFASRFVRKEFRERFQHELAKKPGDLHRRICHEIEKVFDGAYKGQAASFQAQDQCFFLGWSSVTVTTWAEAKARIDQGGGGYLAIKSDGSAFYAETEGYPAQAYAGSS